jgi:hypothetical protein
VRSVGRDTRKLQFLDDIAHEPYDLGRLLDGEQNTKNRGRFREQVNDISPSEDRSPGEL